jgi:hypothetical protein
MHPGMDRLGPGSKLITSEVSGKSPRRLRNVSV